MIELGVRERRSTLTTAKMRETLLGSLLRPLSSALSLSSTPKTQRKPLLHPNVLSQHTAGKKQSTREREPRRKRFPLTQPADKRRDGAEAAAAEAAVAQRLHLPGLCRGRLVLVRVPSIHVAAEIENQQSRELGQLFGQRTKAAGAEVELFEFFRDEIWAGIAASRE